MRPALIVLAVLGGGIALRLVAAAHGHNYDYDSYRMVAHIVHANGNVYAETARYNYGPIWFNIVALLDQAASWWPNQESAFRYLLAGFLTVVDVLIFTVLWRITGRASAVLFFLNPISIIITGFHNQFDNLALLIGMVAVLLFDDGARPMTGRQLGGLVLLGVSLVSKHLLFAFPLWLAMKQRRVSVALCVITVPTVIFLLSFVPYWTAGSQGIIQNVFRFQSRHNEIFVRLFVPQAVSRVLGSTSVWLVTLLICGRICRAKNSFHSLLYYSAVLVAASPAMVNQYLAIPVSFISVYPNPFSILYTVAGTWHLLVDQYGLSWSRLQGLVPLSQSGSYGVVVALLAAATVWALVRGRRALPAG